MQRKLLAFLEEKQEPFALEAFLIERGYIRTSFNSEHSFLCCSSKNYTNLYKKRKSITHCSKVVKTIVSKIVFFKNQHKFNNSNNGDQNVSDRNMGKKVSNFSCSDNVAEGTTNGTIYIENSNIVIKDDIELARKDVEDSNQLSPISVLELEETHFDATKSLLKTSRNYVKRIQEASPLVIHSSKLESPFELSSKGMQQDVSSNFLAHYTKNKNALLHSNQLLLDCVRETMDDHTSKERNVGQQFQKILGVEELWKNIYENIWLWSKDTIDETNIEHLLHFDFLASMEEWNNCEKQRSEIGEAIANAIFDDIINGIMELHLGL